MENRMTPKAPKDPTAKRSSVYILADAVVDGAPRGNGKFQDIIYLNGRIEKKIEVLCKDVPEEIRKGIPLCEGFRKMVHSIGVMITAKNEKSREHVAQFALNCLPKNPSLPATVYSTDVLCNGEEAKISVAETANTENDDILGSFVTTFPEQETAVMTVRFYLNDGYTAPEMIPDPPVDFQSDAYKRMIARSLVQEGDLERCVQAARRAAEGKEVTVAYLGGSITQGAAAKPINTECYAYLSYLDFKKRFGSKDGSNVHFIKAGAGGTCSELGLTRYEKDVLRYGKVVPDIVFVEYAVNDGGDETDGECFENLVRMIAEGPGKPAVILLFSVFMNDSNLQERMIPVGQYYHLPMISIKNAVTPQFYDKTPVITKRQYFYDVFHPSNDGHRIMADCIDYLWKRVAEKTGDATLSDADVWSGQPYRSKRFSNLHCFDRSNAESKKELLELSEGSFSEQDTQLQYVERDDVAKAVPEFPDNWSRNNGTGNTPFSMRLICKDLLLVYKDSGNPQFGVAEIFVDGKKTREINPLEVGWDHCTAYIVYESDSAAEHTVTISMKEGDEEKSFTVLGFGYTV